MSFTTESLETFQLASNQFSAADGRSSGAAISLVTKSGTNQLHGTVFGYERDRKLTSKDYFTRQGNGTKSPFSRQQFGGSFGGPIVKNKMFFFGAGEQQQQHQGIFIPRICSTSSMRSSHSSRRGSSLRGRSTLAIRQR